MANLSSDARGACRARPLAGRASRSLRTAIAAVALALLVAAGPAAGFALSLTIEYLRAMSAGGDRVEAYGTLRPDDLGTPANNPWHEGVATHSLRSGAQHLIATLRIGWQARTNTEIIAFVLVWTLPPAMAAVIGFTLSLGAVSWLLQPGYMAVPGVRSRVWARLRDQSPWLLILTAATLPLCGMLSAQRHLALGVRNGQGYASGVPTTSDLVATSALAVAAGICVGAIALLRIVRRCVGPGDLHCWCGYSVPEGTLARCPECGRPAPSMPPKIRLLGASDHARRVIGTIAVLTLLGVAAAWTLGLVHVRQVFREALFGTMQSTGDAYRLQIPTAWPVLIEFEDGVGLVVVEREIRWLDVPAVEGRSPASVTGMDVITRCACAFWNIGEAPKDTLPPRSVFVSGSGAAATLSDNTHVRCGPHAISLGHSIVSPEFTHYTTRSVVLGFETSHRVNGLENAISMLRKRLREQVIERRMSPEGPETDVGE